MIYAIIILSLLILTTSLLLPWWIIVVVSFLFTIVSKKNSAAKSIFISFVSGLIAYFAISVYISIGVERSPAELIGNLFGNLPAWSAYLITGLIGGIAAAFGGLSGFLGKKIFRRQRDL